MRAAVLTLMTILLLAVVPASGLRASAGCGQAAVAADICLTAGALPARSVQKAELPGKCIDIILPGPLAAATGGPAGSPAAEWGDASARHLEFAHWRPPRAVS